MNRLKIKVCGLREPANIEAVAGLTPDYMGFIFFKESNRWIGKAFDPVHLNLLHAETKACGVFVGEYLPTLIDRVDYYHLDAVQLHGDEPAEYCRKLRSKLKSIEIIKAFGIDEQFDFNSLAAYQQAVDYFLFDAKGKERGGNGAAFDWRLLHKYTLAKPFFLSGGLGPGAADGLKELAAGMPLLGGVDLNSGFESEPGIKSAELLAAFLKELM